MKPAVIMFAVAVVLGACGGNSGSTTVVVAIGERVEVEGYPDIIVEEFWRTTNEGELASEFFTNELEPGHEFWILRLRVINDTDAPAGVDGFWDLRLLSRGEDIASATSYILTTPDELEAEVLPPGAEASGNVAWEVVQGFDELRLRYRPFSASGLELFDPENLFDNPVEDLPGGLVDLERTSTDPTVQARGTELRAELDVDSSLKAYFETFGELMRTLIEQLDDVEQDFSFDIAIASTLDEYADVMQDVVSDFRTVASTTRSQLIGIPDLPNEIANEHIEASALLGRAIDAFDIIGADFDATMSGDLTAEAVVDEVSRIGNSLDVEIRALADGLERQCSSLLRIAEDRGLEHALHGC